VLQAAIDELPKDVSAFSTSAHSLLAWTSFLPRKVPPSELTGEVTILGTACWSVGEVSRNVSGDAVVFGAIFASDMQNFVGTVAAEGLDLEGSYDVSGRACMDAIGKWRVIKTAEPCDAPGHGTIDRQDMLDLLGFLLRGGDPLSADADCNRDGVPNFWDVLAILKARSV
jgi:hypothetical protein